MRADEWPLRSDLDVARLKAQVLRRVGELEARERERKELLAEESGVVILDVDPDAGRSQSLEKLERGRFPRRLLRPWLQRLALPPPGGACG